MVATTAPSLLERWGTFLFKYRDAVFPAVILALIVTTRPQFPGGSRSADLWLDALGILVCAAGQALRITVIGYRYIVRGGKDRRVHAEDLVTGGIFALARNPLYVGNMMVLFIVAAEEAFLRTKFGPPYDEYCRTTNRWFPDFRKAPEALRDIPFNWRRVLIREYGSWTAWICTAGVMIIAESLMAAPYETHASLINAIVVAMIVVLVAWAVTRWLKLNKRIRA